MHQAEAGLHVWVGLRCMCVQLGTIPRIGNSPTFISIAEFKKLAPLWFNTTMDIWNNKAAHEVCVIP